jgi:hypothetical protein
LTTRSSASLEISGFAVPDFDALNWLYAMRPQVAPVGDRFVIGWLNFERRLVVASVDSNGGVACGPTVLPNVVGSWNAMHALESDGKQVLAVLSNADDRAVLLRLNSRCAVVGEPLELQAPGTRLSRGSGAGPVARAIGFGHPAIARTDSGFAVAWIEESAPTAPDAGVGDAGSVPNAPLGDALGGAPRLMLRTFGSRLCN